MTYEAGQLWTYNAPPGHETSRIVIGAVATISDGQRIICFSVTDAARTRPTGDIDTITIPFIPMSEHAFQATVSELVGRADPPDSFSQGLQTWSDDARGLSVFTVPFEGFLDRMIALQMAAIVGQTAA